VENAAALFSAPEAGLRTTIGVDEIALFEWASVEASEGMKRLIEGLREGASDHELAGLMGFKGAPQGCHWTLKTGPNRISLASAKGDIVRRGNTFSANICYWGANCCRAGWVAETAADLPAEARDYAETFAGPYVAALGGWFERFRLGVEGGELERWIRETLPVEQFGIKLNPGHLIHLDEWTSSPIYRDSRIPLRSGMAFQCDVIPSSPKYFSTRMEDTYVLADAALQDALDAKYPAVLQRCLARRAFMRDELGFPVSDDVLPLTNLPGVVQPYFLDPGLVFVLGE
jgi:Xaa-Pro aminopeptidase